MASRESVVESVRTPHGLNALTSDRHRATVLTILVGAGLWAWWAISRGWFLQADLSNLADGMNTPLGWSYLSRPLGGHFAPVARILYWLLDQIAPLDYGVGVLFRVALHVLASWLLYRLLTAMVGHRWIVVAGTALWAFNPVVLSGTAWLASGIGAVLAQCFAVLALERWVRWLRTRDLVHAWVAGGWFALTILTFDTYAALAPVPLLLTLSVFTRGGPGARIARLVRDWPAVLAWLLPPAAAVGLELGLGNGAGASTLSVHRALRLLGDAWTRMIAPSLVGGPLRWYEPSPGSIPFALTADWFRIAAEIAIAVVVVGGTARLGWRSLLAWVTPVVSFVILFLFVGIGRGDEYGGLIAITPRYGYPLVVLFVIAFVTAFYDPSAPPTTADREDDSVDADEADHRAGPVGRGAHLVPGIVRGPLGPQLVIGVAAVAVLIASLASTARFASSLGDGPARSYVDTLTASVRARGANVNLYDTAVPDSVVTTYEPSHRVSDVLKLARVSARFQEPTSAPLLVNPDGTLSKAVFVSAAVATPTSSAACGTFVHGNGVVRLPLAHAVHAAEWFVRLNLYQATPSTVSVVGIDPAGHRVNPLHGARLTLSALESRVLALPLAALSAIEVRSYSDSTNLCLAQISVGGPFASGPA